MLSEANDAGRLKMGKNAVTSVLGKYSKRSEGFLLLLILILVIPITIITKGLFLSFGNLLDVFITYIYMGIMAVGMLVVIISGGMDISFAANATIAQYIISLVLINYGTNMLVAFLIPCAVGFTIGLVNSILIYKFNCHSMIITIAMMNVLYGLLQWLIQGKNLYGYPKWFSKNGPCGDYLPIVLFIAVIIVTSFILNRTKTGRKIFAIGGNMEAARRVGVNIFRTQMFIYCYMGVLAGLASAVQLYIIRNFTPNALVGKELDVIAAVIIGGASLLGGKGTIGGTLLGVLLLALIENGLVLLGISSYYQTVVTGAVILLSLIFNSYSQKSAGSRAAS